METIASGSALPFRWGKLSSAGEAGETPLKVGAVGGVVT